MRPLERKGEYPCSIQGGARVGDSATATGLQAAIDTASLPTTPRPAPPLRRSLPTLATSDNRLRAFRNAKASRGGHGVCQAQQMQAVW